MLIQDFSLKYVKPICPCHISFQNSGVRFVYLNPILVTLQKGKLKPVHVVDVPGHSCLRSKLEEFLPQAAGVVFVVDAVEFLPNSHAASEYVLPAIDFKSTHAYKSINILDCDSNISCFFVIGTYMIF